VLKIYGRTTSSNVQKVLWCCGEIGLEFDRIDIDAAFGGLKTPAYLALNPNGVMPTIDEDGFVLWESNVIVRYLAAKHSLGDLCPADLRERADCERWMDWQQTSIATPMGIAFRALLRNPREAMPEMQWRAAVQRAGDLWRMLDARLADRLYVGGDGLTMGDIVLGNAIHRWYKLPADRPDLPHLRQWYDRLCERPAYQKHIASA
jgi:glutathione S-transferase